ncbi:MoaD/ThiS family protein [Winogradskya consettensis]|uniref:Molybdopterin synthase sulfur carrier subunit n=1 Tax=Winogradskya consettensis TaxID=113560 RepID=A0A919VTF4_9ACTN|nr:MoaD/ThiS family protein [Actinoplanes consettensis]GIM68822.1 molybdopterin synthase sulfur carrier subunit [Actinoplanes consettensis]
MPVVLVPGALRAEAGGEGRLNVEADGSLRAVLDEIGQRWPRLERRLRDETGVLRRYVNVYVDGEDCRRSGGLDTPVPAAAEIQVLPSVAGG